MTLEQCEEEMNANNSQCLWSMHHMPDSTESFIASYHLTSWKLYVVGTTKTPI